VARSTVASPNDQPFNFAMAVTSSCRNEQLLARSLLESRGFATVHDAANPFAAQVGTALDPHGGEPSLELPKTDFLAAAGANPGGYPVATWQALLAAAAQGTLFASDGDALDLEPREVRCKRLNPPFNLLSHSKNCNHCEH